jgi:hypothetical protein
MIKRIVRDKKAVLILHNAILRTIIVSDVYGPTEDRKDCVEILYKDAAAANGRILYRGRIVCPKKDTDEVVNSFVNVLCHKDYYCIMHGDEINDEINQNDDFLIADFEKKWDSAISENEIDSNDLSDDQKHEIEKRFDEYIKKELKEFAENYKNSKYQSHK